MLVARCAFLPALATALLAVPSAASESERLYLSGRGGDDAREWEFRIESGRRAGEGWSTLAVPSQWELLGFGTYRYGRHDGSGGETGRYRHRFTAPGRWRGRRVDLVFAGVMTDTEAWINGRPVGPVHHGGFTRFSYDVTDLLDYDGDELLEVRVAERSANRSVDLAERDADYWVFGGIYRPVWLEARPPTAITHVAIDARHDGRLTAVIELDGEIAGARVVARVQDLDGRPLGAELAGAPAAGAAGVTIDGRLPGALPWSAERPRLYELRLRLTRGGETLHEARRRFGFRTVELRYGEGLFVNGHRELLRGINRHSFWPDSGRALSDAINRRDAELLRELNVNAVRTSHYPPDEAFLDACDELGLYVVDELPGWHDAYDTEVGERLVAEMVRRDVNHPSILLWANGNEGGWNRALDDDFALHDPQRRPVILPDDVHAGVATFHYPRLLDVRQWLDEGSPINRLRAWLGRARLVMPTEMLHGLYDGGLGAGLEGVWSALRGSPRAVGGFLWAFLDEGVVRTDRGGEIDTFGNYAPDGLVGPYREREASFRTVRRLWSPIQIEPPVPGDGFDGELGIENRFSEIDLSECSFAWRTLALPAPGGELEELAGGVTAGPRVAPGGHGSLRLELPPGRPFDALEVSASGPDGRVIETWSFPVVTSAELIARWVGSASGAGQEGGPTAPEGGGEVVLRAGDRGVELTAGQLRGLLAGEVRIPLTGGPRQVLGGPPAFSRGRRVTAGEQSAYYAAYDEGLSGAAWTLFEDGWLRLEAGYRAGDSRHLQGVVFDLPERWIESFQWLGRGPDPVWGNRLAGPRLGLWRRTLAETAPGRQARGFYDGVAWMRLNGADGVLTVVPAGEVYVGVSAPRFDDDFRSAVAEVPGPDTLSFLDRISPMGTKFHRGESFPALDGPPVEPAPGGRVTIWFHWQAAGGEAGSGAPAR